MKFILTLILILLKINAYGQDAYSNNDFLNADIPLSNSFGTFRYMHVEPTGKDNSSIKSGKGIGKISAYPNPISQQFEGEIYKSRKYYDNGQYDSAKAILENAIIMESENPFILNNYARACYYIDRPTSFKIYKKLISQLDSAYGNCDTLTVVDFWFQESYWKLGTLYLDEEEWRNAYYEISRFLGAIQSEKGELVYIQALQYLTECAFNSYDDKLAAYLANRVIYYDNENEYALMVLREIKR